MRAPTIRRWLFEQTIALVAYLAFALALTWPLARDFTTRLVGHVFYDMRHAVWIQWYVKEALLGRARWPETRLLHAPYGITTVVDGVGPLHGIFGLPFWPWGPAAVFNGTALAGLALSGWCLYLLARHLGLDRAPAFIAGLLFMAWPIHLVGLYGHLEKLFVGLLPLTLLAGLVAFDLRRRWTIFAPGAVLLALLLDNGNQFMFAALGLGILAIAQLLRTPRALWLAQAGRIAIVAIVSLAICLPPLHLILTGASHPLMLFKLGDASAYYAPDLLQFIVPSLDQLVPGLVFYPHRVFTFDSTMAPVVPSLAAAPPAWYGSGIETAVAIPITALALGLAACWLAPRGDDRREARRWLLFGAVFAVLALGPILRVAGYTTFTPWNVQVSLPHAWLAAWVPGFDVMRTPGRYMMMGSVGFSIAAGIGLTALGRWAGARRHWALIAGATLVLVECWPAPWPQHVLPPVPAFYQKIAGDGERYAVLDLPAGWPGRNDLSSAYQYYQVTHRKPIAWSYLSRSYMRFPMPGLDALWNRDVRDYERTRRRLARLGYRYVVWHKHAAALFSLPRGDDASEHAPPGPPEPAQTDPFLRWAFEGEPPVYDDDLVTVYRITPSP